MRDVRVAIVGAGFAGVGLAARLLRRGYSSVTVFERGSSIGGVWRDNSYPGAECDVQSYLYSYSFAPKRDWSRDYAPQREIERYIRAVADRFRVTDHVRFGTDVVSAHWDDVARTWTLEDANGAQHVAEIVVFACGQMSHPLIPDVPGVAKFAGPAMHSARWDSSIDLAGRNVAVVGTGASAIQFVPEIAEIAGHVTVYQRSPAHVMPKANTVREKPLSRRGFWAKRYGLFLQKELLSFRVNHAPSLMRFKERAFARHLKSAVPNPVLRDLLTPRDRFGCKRILVSDHWYPALQRDNVEVVAAPVVGVETDSIVAADGVTRPTDVIVYGTGFRSTRFMLPLDIRGAGGVSLDDEWALAAHAYLGLQVPGFPNMFLTYGPNTNVGHNSILFMIECQLHYIVSAVGRAARTKAPVEVSTKEAADFRRWVQRRSGRTVYATGCTNWFVNENGVHTQNWPGSVIPYWWRTRWVRARRMRDTRAS